MKDRPWRKVKRTHDDEYDPEVMKTQLMNFLSATREVVTETQFDEILEVIRKKGQEFEFAKG